MYEENYNNLTLFVIISIIFTFFNRYLNSFGEKEELFNKVYNSCKFGDIKILNELLISMGQEKFHQNMNQANENDNGRTPLSIACRYDHFETMKLLVLEGANINHCDIDGFTPICTACANNYIEIVKHLISKDVDINIANNRGFTPLFLACNNGHLEIVKLLLSKDADMNKAVDIGNDKFTPLYIACNNGHLEIVKYLISKDINININTLLSNNNGLAPLYIACYKGHLDIVKYLISLGVDMNISSNYGCTPSCIVCSNDHLGVKYLISLCLDMNITDNEIVTPFYIACQEGHLEIIKYLIPLGIDMNKANNNGDTPLKIACHLSHLNIVKLLLYYDVDMTDITLSGYKTQLNLPNDEFSDNSTNEVIKFYFIKQINWNNRKVFINFLDKTGFLYGSKEENKDSNKRNRDSLSLDAHNCIHNNNRLISCFLGKFEM
jgi:ankyrin repeat protein